MPNVLLFDVTTEYGRNMHFRFFMNRAPAKSGKIRNAGNFRLTFRFPKPTRNLSTPYEKNMEPSFINFNP